MTMLLVAGIVVIAAGLLAIVAGIPVKEFSLGNTLILAGTVAASAGAILIGLSRVVRELQNIVRLATPRPKAAPDLSASSAASQPAPEAGPQPSPAASPSGPSQEDAASQGGAAAAPAEPAPAKPRRNLLFSSSRRERERAAAPSPEPAAADAAAPPAATPLAKEAAPATFDDAWPQSERARSDAVLRRARAPSTLAEPNAGAKAMDQPAAAAPGEQPPHGGEPPPVTVLKSGVVDGMAYSLYSDGSIEAQMPEGMMRFASIDELRSHLDHRP